MTVVNIKGHFILRISPSVLAKALYAWLPIVAFFTWPPVLSGLLAFYLILSLTLLRVQQNAWEKYIKADLFGTGPVAHKERFAPPLRAVVLNLVVVMIGGLILSALFAGKAGLSGAQWFLLTAGFVWIEQFLMLVWLPTRYLLTERGVWILSSASRLFVAWKDIAEVRLVRNCRLPMSYTYMFVPVKVPIGTYLFPVDQGGFSWRAKNLLLIIKDVEKLRQFIPSDRTQETSLSPTPGFEA